MPRLPAMAFIIKEFDEALPSIVFFAVGFNLFEFTTQLMLGDYMGRVANFLLATAAALVVGKAVLLADRLPFPRRFYAPPLIKPILFKTAVYTAVVFLVRNPGRDRRILALWRNDSRHSRLYSASYFLALSRCDSNLGFHPVPHLYLGRRA